MKHSCSVKPVYSADPRFAGCAEVFSGYAKEALGVGWTEGEGGVVLAADGTCGPEEYRLRIAPEGVRIAVDRIFKGYYKMNGGSAFTPAWSAADAMEEAGQDPDGEGDACA